MPNRPQKFAISLIMVTAFAAIGGSALSMPLKTLPHGRYVCALAGNASGAAWRPIPGKVIVIRNASSYRTKDGSGTYLMAGKMVTFTRGPLKDEKFEQIGTHTLQRLRKDGSLGKIHCLRGGLIEPSTY